MNRAVQYSLLILFFTVNGGWMELVSGQELPQAALQTLREKIGSSDKGKMLLHQKDLEKTAAAVFSWRLDHAPRGYEGSKEFQDLSSQYWTKVLQDATPLQTLKIDDGSVAKWMSNYERNSGEFEKWFPELNKQPLLAKKSEKDVLESVLFAMAKAETIDGKLWQTLESDTSGWFFCWLFGSSAPSAQKLAADLKTLQQHAEKFHPAPYYIKDASGPAVTPSK